ncbi:hypothetical protein SDJN03_23192, partial [Cucurbita argyrosperma subsp. sororia]
MTVPNQSSKLKPDKFTGKKQQQEEKGHWRMLTLISATPDKAPASGGVKKRLSFPASPANSRRHSGPPKVDTNPIKNVADRDFTGESR